MKIPETLVVKTQKLEEETIKMKKKRPKNKRILTKVNLISFNKEKQDKIILPWCRDRVNI